MLKIAGSVRLILAMFNIIAGIEEGFGKAIINILKKQYPDQDINIHPGTIGSRMLAVARKQNQGDIQRSMDSIQDFLTYISVGANQGKGWDFRKDFDTWQKALDAIYSNVRLRSMTRSMENQKRKKREKSVDDAFGKRDEGGGAAEGGEGRMPTPSSNPLSKALDDQTAIKSFMDLMDQKIPELRAYLSEDTGKLFSLIFDDDVGSFNADIKDNMNQASAFKEKYPELYEKNKKRWSGFVGDTRKKLLEEIWDFVNEQLDPEEFGVLRETFFSDTDPVAIRQKERDKLTGKKDYQQGLDERKLARMKWQDSQGLLDAKGKTSLKNLSDKLIKQGIDTSSIQAEENPNAKNWKLHNRAASIKVSFSSIASRVASYF